MKMLNTSLHVHVLYKLLPIINREKSLLPLLYGCIYAHTMLYQCVYERTDIKSHLKSCKSEHKVIGISYTEPLLNHHDNQTYMYTTVALPFPIFLLFSFLPLSHFLSYLSLSYFLS